MMKLFMVMVVIMGGLVREWRVMANGDVSVDGNDNREPYELLCRIYNVAHNPPIKPVDTKEYQKIVDDINALSAAANGKERINTQTEEAKSAQTQLIGISRDARKLLEEIKKVNPEGEAQKARNAFNAVIFGEHGKEGDLSQGELRGVEGSRLRSCGSKDKEGTTAGKSLLVDFFCLCAKHDEAEGVNNVCGVSVGDGVGMGWGTKLQLADTMWNAVKDGCKMFAPQRVTSTQDGYSLYHEFLEKVKAGAKVKLNNSGTVQQHGMLGTAVSASRDTNFNCNGQKKVITTRDKISSGICVFYGVGKVKEGIIWLKKFKEGLQLIDKLNTETASWQHQLTTLLNRARELYEKVKANTQQEEEDTEESPLTQHPNPDETENTDSTTRSMRHSFLAWALLLQ
ncbi:Variant surface glycoprotein [Trypanosoma congolense IL3000]|uniref:Variant surface glycoprotein n=1 Tax=Trypanosoma congolense (strain IL3000) TaxID=1068625 RepID=F9WD87_TRYCI|nr:Variant surface glycoprotein [Trypanosoma congolense IL3000]